MKQEKSWKILWSRSKCPDHKLHESYISKETKNIRIGWPYVSTSKSSWDSWAFLPGRTSSGSIRLHGLALQVEMALTSDCFVLLSTPQPRVKATRIQPSTPIRMSQHVPTAHQKRKINEVSSFKQQQTSKRHPTTYRKHANNVSTNLSTI